MPVLRWSDLLFLTYIWSLSKILYSSVNVLVHISYWKWLFHLFVILSFPKYFYTSISCDAINAIIIISLCALLRSGIHCVCVCVCVCGVYKYHQINFYIWIHCFWLCSLCGIILFFRLLCLHAKDSFCVSFVCQMSIWRIKLVALKIDWLDAILCVRKYSV